MCGQCSRPLLCISSRSRRNSLTTTKNSSSKRLGLRHTENSLTMAVRARHSLCFLRLSHKTRQNIPFSVCVWRSLRERFLISLRYYSDGLAVIDCSDIITLLQEIERAPVLTHHACAADPGVPPADLARVPKPKYGRSTSPNFNCLPC